METPRGWSLSVKLPGTDDVVFLKYCIGTQELFGHKSCQKWQEQVVSPPVSKQPVFH